MCGIAGVVGYREGARTESRELVALRDAQAHRGPDDAGEWLSADGRVGLAHRRLSIIDLSAAGHQPMADEAGRFRVTYNGEIYNFAALRAELERGGARFRTSSDTEVLLHGYRAWGTDLLDRLRGMFAFALHDAERNETLIARDPLGIKPVYLLDDGARVLFSSEIQPLRAVADAGDVDPEGLASYLLWGSIPPPRTLYSRIRSLPAGHFQQVSNGSPGEPTAWFRLEDCFGRSEEMDEVEAAQTLRDALADSARAHQVADVPVGAFLSGGVDSSALVGLLSESGNAKLRTVTLSFDDDRLDEAPLARMAAAHYDSDHREIPIRVEDIRERMPLAIRALDQPSVDGVNTYFVSEAAVEAGLKVAVSGVGGDELFGGYTSFQRLPRIRRIHDRLAAIPLLGARLPGIASALGALPRSSQASRLSLALQYGGTPTGAYVAERCINTTREVRALLAPEIAEAVDAVDPARDLAARLPVDGIDESEHVSAFELRQYLQVQLLRDTDTTSMRHALEVRTPLVDRTLLEAVTRVPARYRFAGPAKKALREAPVPPVPEALWNRRKQGFILPFDTWLRTGGLESDLPEHPWLRGDALRDVKRSFDGRRLHWSRLWQLLILREFL